MRSAHVTRHLPLSKYVHTHSGRSKNERGDCDNESEDSIESSVCLGLLVNSIRVIDVM